MEEEQALEVIFSKKQHYVATTHLVAHCWEMTNRLWNFPVFAH